MDFPYLLSGIGLGVVADHLVTRFRQRKKMLPFVYTPDMADHAIATIAALNYSYTESAALATRLGFDHYVTETYHDNPFYIETHHSHPQIITQTKASKSSVNRSIARAIACILMDRQTPEGQQPHTGFEILSAESQYSVQHVAEYILSKLIRSNE